MDRRFEARKKKLIDDSKIEGAVFKGAMDRLTVFAKPFMDLMPRIEQRKHMQVFIEGLMSDLERKNIESIAYRYDQDRMNLQRFIGWGAWDHAPLMTELAKQVGMELGEPAGVIVFDPSGFEKNGRESVGVKRQWLGRFGKVDNGQVAVYMGYASKIDYALVDTRLFLPEEWARDRKRRQKGGVPKRIRFSTRLDLALEMLREKGELLPHSWIAGDDEMGRSTYFRKALREMNERYLLNVPSNTNIRDLEASVPKYSGHGPRPKRQFERVDKWAAALSEKSWTRVDVRDGEKGPLIVEIVKTRVLVRTERKPGEYTEEVLVVTRSKEGGRKYKHDYSLSNAALETPLEELARVFKAEHHIEECIQRAKGEAGLADYEVRNWKGWHHHQVLSLMATWFMIREKLRGEKLDPRNYSSANTSRACIAVA